MNPAESNGTVWCEYFFSWLAAIPDQKLDAQLVLNYNSEGVADQISIPITGKLQFPVGVVIHTQIQAPELIDFGIVDYSPRNKRVPLLNTGRPNTVLDVQFYAERQDVADSFSLDHTNCTKRSPPYLVHEEKCTLILTWRPAAGDPLTQTEVIVTYQAEPDNEGNQSPQKEIVIPVSGTPPPATLRSGVPGQLALSPGEAQALQDRRPSALEVARLRHAFLRSVPSLGKDELGNNIGLVQIPAPRKTRLQNLHSALEIGQLNDADYRALGLPPQTGLSSRPVNLESVILAGEIIQVTITQGLDASSPTLVTGFVNQSVYSYHGRNVIIPKGSVVLGRSLPVSLPQNLIAAAGLGSNPQATTAQPSTAFQGKVLIDWDRIYTPDGVLFRPTSENEGGFASQDVMGRTGVPGHYNPKELATFLARVTQVVGQGLVTLGPRKGYLAANYDNGHREPRWSIFRQSRRPQSMNQMVRPTVRMLPPSPSPVSHPQPKPAASLWNRSPTYSASRSIRDCFRFPNFSFLPAPG